MFYHWIKFNDYIDVIYQEQLEINDTTDAPKWANFLGLRLEYDEDGKLYIRLYDKRDEFDFPTVNFPYLTSNIPESSAYAVLVSQLIRYARVFSGFRNMKTFCSEDLLWFPSYWSRDILHGNLIESGIFFGLLFGKSMVAIQTLFRNITLLCHIELYVEGFVHQLWHMT